MTLDYFMYNHAKEYTDTLKVKLYTYQWDKTYQSIDEFIIQNKAKLDRYVILKLQDSVLHIEPVQSNEVLEPTQYTSLTLRTKDYSNIIIRFVEPEIRSFVRNNLQICKKSAFGSYFIHGNASFRMHEVFASTKFGMYHPHNHIRVYPYIVYTTSVPGDRNKRMNDVDLASVLNEFLFL